MTDDEIALWLITKGTMEDKPVMSLAADRILTLRAERDEALEDLSASQGYIADAIFALDKQKAAEAERDQLREALEQFLIEYDVVDLANAEPSSLTAAVLDARAALKGDSHE